MSDDIVGNWIIDPEHSRALRLGMILKCRDEGRDEEVIVEAEELLNSEPDCPEALFYLGEAFLQLGDAEGAFQAFSRHIQVQPNAEYSAVLGLAMAHFDQCQLEKAESLAREALQMAPESAKCHYLLGLILETDAERSSEAVQHYSAANQLDPVDHPFPLSLEIAEWKSCVQQAMQGVEQEQRDFWEGLPVHLFAMPDLAELMTHQPPISPRITGLYTGTAPEDGDGDGDGDSLRPEGLRLYTRNLARCRSKEDLIGRIIAVLNQERLAWLGLPEETDTA